MFAVIRPTRRGVVAGSIGAVVALTNPLLTWAKGWEVVKNESGIVVRIRYVDGWDLPIVRGTGAVPGSVYDVLAVLGDAGRYSQWMHSCRKARLVREINEYERIIHNRIATPWPVDDRDTVVHTRVSVNAADRAVLVTFDAINDSAVPEIEDVVRMPYLKGFYFLEWKAEDRTRVTYQAKGDVGGLLPAWLVESGQIDLPFETIASLRRQVKATRGKYEEFLKKWDPAHGGVGMDHDGHPQLKSGFL